MTARQFSTTVERLLGRDVLNAARNYFGNRWAVLALGFLAISIIGLSFGGWGWLLAVGAAPIILSLLPCLVMCGLGACMMCRSNKSQSAASDDAAGSSAPRWTNQVLVGQAAAEVVLWKQAPQPKQIRSLD